LFATVQCVTAAVPVLKVSRTAFWMVAETCSVGETVLVLVACVPANAAVDSAITAEIKRYFFITILLVLIVKWTQRWGGIERD
jgi:hypothetical protein